MSAQDPAVAADARRQWLFAKWRRIDETTDKDRYEEAEAAWSAAEEELVDTPAASLAGILAKLRLAAETLEVVVEKDDLIDRAVRGSIADLERLIPQD